MAENDTLRLLAEEDARLRDDNTHLEQQVQVLQQQLTAVQAENDALRGPAGEYQSLKEHVADIEISAHRRTEEFRARAMERLGQCIAQQRLWCSQRRSTYLNMNTALAEQLRAAQEAVDSADFTAFDDMIARGCTSGCRRSGTSRRSRGRGRRGACRCASGHRRSASGTRCGAPYRSHPHVA